MSAQDPVRVQRVNPHPRLTAIAVVLAALGLIVAVSLASTSFAQQQRLNRANAALAAKATVLARQNSMILAQVQAKITAEHNRDDARWCDLFTTILNTPRPPGPVTPASQRFTDIIARLNDGFAACLRR